MQVVPGRALPPTMQPAFMPVRPFISPFRSTVPRAPMPNNTSTLVPPRSKIRATSVPAPESLPTRPQDLTPTIFGTPCFTPNIMSSPMPLSHRQVYLSAAARATAEYISALPHSNTTSSPVAQITLSLPQLNPELDIYDRRFLLQLAWAIVAVTAVSCNLRTRVLVQGSGAFGGIPLSVAGLRRTFDADVQVSRDAWPQDSVQTGTLENEDDLVDDDQIIICLSPTNAVSVPAIQSLMEMVRRANGRPVILLNPRLADVPSHSGVMQVSGRADRIRFLESITDIFYLRLLFSAGTNYPLRGILYRAYTGSWQVWRPEDGNTNYFLISTSDDRPSPSQITDAIAIDRYARQKRQLEQEIALGTTSSIESFVTSPLGVAFIALCTIVGIAAYMKIDVEQLLHGAALMHFK